LSIDVEALKSEREKQKAHLRELETEQRKMEGDLKSLRQREIRCKREIEALSTLIELNSPPDPAAAAPADS